MSHLPSQCEVYCLLCFCICYYKSRLWIKRECWTLRWHRRVERYTELRRFVAEMKFFFCVFFLVASCGLSVGIIREYSYLNYTGNVYWYQAQWHCKNYYRDLATVTTAEEHQRLVAIGNNEESAWIGLYRTNTQNIWKWSDGEPVSYLNWQYNSPVNSFMTYDYDCTVVYRRYWTNDHCGQTHYFYCYRFLILVNESKTWEEALQYCTTNYTGLASLPYKTQLWQAKLELELTQTDSVWTGLYFMDGKWFWLNGEPLETLPGTGQPPRTLVSLPSCPARPYHCGAFNIKTNIWENRDCNEKLNFLCWR
ncbi:macrophage mannose receptor 1-like [Pangasianodon hypophthalmus]|uniref:macrophage mannose receptor 1-like n=1 Tax=Pangasianodon hypophthalmus TaxID=310915 RepID=UPI00230775CF|nr:macrophage mannose receptor 1-like [Pangasianodon hypophthalmus]